MQSLYSTRTFGPLKIKADCKRGAMTIKTGSKIVHSAQHEERAENNHGSWYAAQRASYALFAGKENIAKEILAGARVRIGEQFDADGNQAAELKRTLSLHYCVFNITALSRLACVGDEIGEDLWDTLPITDAAFAKAWTCLCPI